MSNGEYQQLIKAIDGLGRIMGVIYVHYLGDVELGIKAEHLSRCGFSNTEIADLLGSTPNSINVALHKARHPKPKKKSGK